MPIAQLTSKIDTVKVYAAGATVTRIAELQIKPGEAPDRVEIAGLPLALDDSSVRVRVESDRAIAPIAGDVRIGLAVPPPQLTPPSPATEELRAAKAEVQRIEDLITLIDNEIGVLYQLHVPDRPPGEPGKAPPPSPMSARLALANFTDEQVRVRIEEKRETEEKLRKAREHLEDLLQKQSRASSAAEVREHELRKTVVVRLIFMGEVSVVGRLVLEYFVPGARWSPTYVCRVNSAESTAAIAVRALLCQRTGEDWSGVRLELSTAEPMGWCELPELRSLRIGRAQPVPRKSGWRIPPIGAEILFEDFDRYKEKAIALVRRKSAIADISFPELPPLPNIVSRIRKQRYEKIEQEIEQWKESLTYQSQELKRQEIDDALATPKHKSKVLRAKKNANLSMNFLDDRPDYKPPTGLATRSASASMAPGFSFRLPSLPKAAVSTVVQQTISEVFSPDRDGMVFSLAYEPASAVDFVTNILAYSFMRMYAADDPVKRGKLSIEQRYEAYLEILQRQKVVVSYNVMNAIDQAVSDAENCLFLELPPGGINVRQVAGSFDYAYSADGRVDVPSDGEFHSVALTTKSADVEIRYVVVPAQDTNVFRIAHLRNPLQAPLLAALAEIYLDGEYMFSTKIASVPPKGQMEVGIGVEQAIKVSRNTSYNEASGILLFKKQELHHKIQVEIANNLPKAIRIEVRDRLPIPQEGAKVNVQIDRVDPAWEKYEQKERETPIKGGYRWGVEVPAGDKKTLLAEYTIKTFVDSELIGGNRRE